MRQGARLPPWLFGKWVLVEAGSLKKAFPMKNKLEKRDAATRCRRLAQSAVVAGVALATPVLAQDGPNSSLFSGQSMAPQVSVGQPQAPRGTNDAQRVRFQPTPAPLSSSWYEAPIPAPKEVRVNDIITIRVDMGAKVVSEGAVSRRKTGRYDAVLNDWLVLVGLRKLKVDPQSTGDQRVQAQTNQQYRATADTQTTESLKFEIASKVTAILPNGNLVLEAHRQVFNNEEVWLHSLHGVCRREDIQPGNVILSKDLADLNIEKKEYGAVRDGYKRGWMVRFVDQFNPF